METTPTQLEPLDVARACCAAPFFFDPDELVTAYPNKLICGLPPVMPKTTCKHSSLFIVPQTA